MTKVPMISAYQAYHLLWFESLSKHRFKGIMQGFEYFKRITLFLEQKTVAQWQFQKMLFPSF